jgi:hypothetical protein
MILPASRPLAKRRRCGYSGSRTLSEIRCSVISTVPSPARSSAPAPWPRHEVHVGDRAVALVSVLRRDPHQRRHLVDRAGVDRVHHRHVGPVDLDQRKRERMRKGCFSDGSAIHVQPTTVPPGRPPRTLPAPSPRSRGRIRAVGKRAAGDLVGDQLAVTQCGEERSDVGPSCGCMGTRAC